MYKSIVCTDHGGEEGDCGHDRVTGFAEGDGLVLQRPHGVSCVLQVRVLDGKAQKVQDTLVLSAGTNVLTHFVPVVLKQLHSGDKGWLADLIRTQLYSKQRITIHFL